MGYDIERFQSEVDEEFICPICSDVLEHPVMVPMCEHAFCKICINEWLVQQNTCPVDRQPVTSIELKPVPRILRNFLSCLLITCDYSNLGCEVIVNLECLETHGKECKYNPNRVIPCKDNFGPIKAKDEHQDFRAKKLRNKLRRPEQRINEMREDVSLTHTEDCFCATRYANPVFSTIDHSDEAQNFDEMREDVSLTQTEYCNCATRYAHPISSTVCLSDEAQNFGEMEENVSLTHTEDCIRATRYAHPVFPTNDLSDEAQNLRWLHSIQRARVTNWDYLIVDPDSIMQNRVKRALSVSGCPPRLAIELAKNSHVERWPPGLCSLEIRRTYPRGIMPNRRHYENYYCRKIPGEQAIVITAFDNPHMNDDMVLEPGLVMIFSHGIDVTKQLICRF